MPESTPPRPLPDGLERALGQATGRTLRSLSVLRRVLRQHVRSERDHGVTFNDLEIELRTLVDRAERSVGDRPPNGISQQNLADQVVRWSADFYEQND